MFCPDNFYEIIRCLYSWPRTTNVVWYFQTHGSRDLLDLRSLLDGEEDIIWNNLSLTDQMALGHIILHDQEPISLDINNTAFITYKEIIQTRKNYNGIRKFIEDSGATGLINWFFKSGSCPIICHSELNSPDIKKILDDCCMIECYYWYHAMISRDWFRHWQYHPDLMPKDRSDAAYRFMMYARGLDGTRIYRKEFIKKMREHSSQILYDWDQTNIVSPDHSAKISVNDANLSSIHIVLETLFDTPKIHLTEKIFKPIVMSQPFFVLSGANSLEYLRSYGFQTFRDFWDEGYDTTVNHQDRMFRVEKEIKKILSLSQKEFQDLYRSMIATITHNRNHFFSQDFQNFCIEEMKSNFQKAFDIQKENLKIYPGGTWPKTMSTLINRGYEIPLESEDHMRRFLKSKYLLSSKEDIVNSYPVLSRFLT